MDTLDRDRHNIHKILSDYARIPYNRGQINNIVIVTPDTLLLKTRN
ncbi:MAG: hypothetical protein SW833_13030 [Cyanobacteriota bacterium]|nr:hypothetical protein [Cyanobacteriota bacterium]